LKYDDYVAECEAEGTTPLAMNEWRAERQQAGRVSRETAEPDRIAELEAKLAALTAQLNPEPEPPAPPPKPREWGEDGKYTYCSDSAEAELVMQAGRRSTDGAGNTVIVDHRAVRFSGGLFTTSDKATADWLEAQPEFMGRGGAKNPVVIWRLEGNNPPPSIHRPGVVDGPKTTRTVATPRHADRPTPLHAQL
jgi:hypothetical protein